MLDTKICTTCGIEKTLSEFALCKRNSSGREGSCKACRKIYRDQNKEKFRAKDHQCREYLLHLSPKEWQEMVTYDPLSGEIQGASTHINTYKGSEGYLQVHLKGATFPVHRVAWFLYYSYWPQFIDHIDGDRTNNKLSNLRECNRTENMCNKAAHRKGKLVGCNFDKTRGLWSAAIKLDNGNRVHLGRYASEREASLQYCRYVLKHKLVRREFLPDIFTDEELGI